LSLYADDTWSASRKLVLDYGLRWELNPAPIAASPGLPYLTGSLDNLSGIGVSLSTNRVYQTVYDNFAPRVGFAFTVRDSDKWATVLRGGAGIFFDTGSAAAAINAGEFNQYPYDNLSASGINMSYGNGVWSSLKSQSNAPETLPQYSLFVTVPTLASPRTYQWSLTVEQKLGASSTLTSSYIGNVGQQLIQSAEFNNTVTPYVVPTTIIDPYGYLQVVRNGETSNYQALQLQLRSRFGSQFEALVSDTYAHAIDTGSSDFDTIGYGQANPRANSDNDIRNIFSSLITWKLVGFQGDRFIKAVSGGWSLSSVAQLQSAAPLSVFSIQNNPNEYNGLANVVPGVPTIISQSVDPITNKLVPGGKRLNPAAFTNNSGNADGDSARNGYRLFGLNQWDLAGSRSWPIWKEGTSLTFRVDAFNILNTPNFANVNAQVGATTFGEALGTYAGIFGGNGAGVPALNGVFSNGGPRSLQLSLKLKF
jgi:hypothetical protein